MGRGRGRPADAVEMFEQHLEENLTRVEHERKSGTYRPRPVRRKWINKPGKKNEKRPLGIATVRARVVAGTRCVGWRSS